MIIFLAEEMRNKTKGSQYAKILTKSTAPFVEPLASTSNASNPNSEITTSITAATPPSTPSKSEGLIITPGKSPKSKKLRKKRSRPVHCEPQHYNQYCQICQKIGSNPKILWLFCSGNCGRWFQHLCVREFKMIESIDEVC